MVGLEVAGGEDIVPFKPSTKLGPLELQAHSALHLYVLETRRTIINARCSLPFVQAQKEYSVRHREPAIPHPAPLCAQALGGRVSDAREGVAIAQDRRPKIQLLNDGCGLLPAVG